MATQSRFILGYRRQSDMVWLFSLAGILLLCFLLFCFLIAPSRRGNRTRDFFSDKRYYAHRGLHGGEIPENSLAAFEAACRAGYGIELDVHRTADNQLCVFHDRTLKRMCGVDGTVEENTLAELRTLALAGTQERIPSFDEVLTLIDGRAPLIVEIQGENRDTDVCRLTAERLRAYSGKYCVESFNPFYISWWRKHMPHDVRGILSCRMKNGKSFRGRLQDFLLSNLLLNVIARPDFLAYSIPDRGNSAFRLSRRFGGCPVGWTCRTEEEKAASENAFCVVIFEKIRPDPESLQ